MQWSTYSIKGFNQVLIKISPFNLWSYKSFKRLTLDLSFFIEKESFCLSLLKSCHAIFQCHFDYASTVWFNSATQTLKNKLQVTQNKLIRFIMYLDARACISLQFIFIFMAASIIFLSKFCFISCD